MPSSETTDILGLDTPEGVVHAFRDGGKIKVSPPSEVRRQFEQFSKRRGASSLPESGQIDIGGTRHWIYASKPEEKEVARGRITGKDRPVFEKAKTIYRQSAEKELTPTQERFLQRLVLRAEDIPGQNLIAYVRKYLEDHRDELLKEHEADRPGKALVLAVSGLAELASAAIDPKAAETIKGLAVLKSMPECSIIPSSHLVGSKPGAARRVLEEASDFAAMRLIGLSAMEDGWLSNNPDAHLKPFVYNKAERRYEADPKVVRAESPLVQRLVEALNSSVLPDGLLHHQVTETLPLVWLPDEAWLPKAQVAREGNGKTVPATVIKLPDQERPYPFEYDGRTKKFLAIDRLVNPNHPSVLQTLAKLNDQIKGADGDSILKLHQNAYRKDKNSLPTPRLSFLGAVEVKAWTPEEADEFLRSVKLKPDEPLEADVGVKLSLQVWKEREFVLQFLPLDRENVPEVFEHGQTRPEPIIILRFLGDIPDQTLKDLYEEILRRGLSDVIIQRLPYTQSMLEALGQAALGKIDLSKVVQK